MINFSRRDFLQKGAIGAGTAFAISNSWASIFTSSDLKNSEVDIIIELTAKSQKKTSGNEFKTEYWTYEGKLVKGTRENLVSLPNSYLGPTIQVNTGDKVRVIFKNELSEKSIVHWHGLDVSHENDGHPHYAIKNGDSYQYDFVVENRAGMYWYHPHPHGRTGFQVYQGLAGLFIVRDKEEEKLQLPTGDQELNFVIQDRSFKASGELDYRPSMMGAFGDTLMINGIKKSDPIKVKKGLYRLRFLNGCNARIFNMSFTGGQFRQIGSDGGLLRTAVSIDRFYFAPAERFDCLVDFSNFEIGQKLSIDSLPLVEGRGDKYSLLEFEITDGNSVTFKKPALLSNMEQIKKTEAQNLNNPKKFELIPKRGLGWTISGRAYEDDSYVDDEIVKFGSTEIWEFYNPTGMPHPMHIHGTQFQIVKRESGQLKGCLDLGWKDVVLVMPGDRVQVIKRFNTFKGTFIYHCHNLEHEDMSMMRNFKII
ncbi:MAG: bilirubin oxidase [Halobacteriovorax sp.]|nr:bilirubin oxidase [Halobacteriovorax sp.]|tara:strand:- start:70551 stop:71987 length:1437 start_codon:yes stop_codon:yes gene_type:complete